MTHEASMRSGPPKRIFCSLQNHGARVPAWQRLFQVSFSKLATSFLPLPLSLSGRHRRPFHPPLGKVFPYQSTEGAAAVVASIPTKLSMAPTAAGWLKQSSHIGNDQISANMFFWPKYPAKQYFRPKLAQKFGQKCHYANFGLIIWPTEYSVVHSSRTTEAFPSQ